MDENPNKTEFNRQSDGRFGPGNIANPAGRPKGKSLKEYWKQKFSEMTDEQKEEFTKKVTPELLWQMAEGRPSQGIGQANDLEPLPILGGGKVKDVLQGNISGQENSEVGEAS